MKVVGLSNVNIMKLKQVRSISAMKNKLCDQNTKGVVKTNDVNLQKTSFYKKSVVADDKVKVCYTVISGSYDGLKEPRYVTPGWKYICFTD